MKLFIFLTFISFFMLQCKSQPEKNALQELVFDIDSTLIGQAQNMPEYKFLFHPPVGWEPVSQSLIDTVKSRMPIPDEDSRFDVVPVSVFLSSGSGAVLVFSRIDFPIDTLNITDYYSTLEKSRGDQDLKITEFKKGNLTVKQYLSQSHHQVAFKLITRNQSNIFFQFDYIIPHHFYMNEIKTVESSIGSISLLN